MCLLCQEEDLYFLYLEQMEREAKAARGDAAPAQANWMWPSFAKGEGADAISVPPSAGTGAGPAPASAFVCDDPDSE
jgi:hypothetical protein